MKQLSKLDKTRVNCAAWFKYQYPMYADLLLYIPGIADFILLVQSKGYGCLIVVIKIGAHINHTANFKAQLTSAGTCYQEVESIDQFRTIVNSYL